MNISSPLWSNDTVVDFDPKKFTWAPVQALKPRMLVLIANARSLDRSGIAPGVAPKMVELLKLD